MLTKDFEVLSSIPLFSGLNQTQKNDIFSRLPEIKAFKSGQAVYKKGGNQRYLSILLSGTLDVYETQDRKVLLNRLLAPAVLGSASLFSDEPFVTEIVAKGAVKVVFIEEELLLNLFKDFPLISENYIRFLTKKIVFLNRKLESFSGGSALDRVMSSLIKRANIDGEIVLPKNMSLFAKSLDIGRTSLYRALETLEKKGITEKRDGKLFLNKKP